MKMKSAKTSTVEFARGFSKWNLNYMIHFYQDYADHLPRIMQKPSAQFATKGICQKPPAKSLSDGFGQMASDQFGRISERSLRKKYAIVELTFQADANIHAWEYQLYRPFKEVLRQKLLDWVREQEAGI
jgi:hypothetical protein